LSFRLFAQPALDFIGGYWSPGAVLDDNADPAQGIDFEALDLKPGRERGLAGTRCNDSFEEIGAPGGSLFRRTLRATLEGTPMLPTDRAMLGMTLRYRAAEDAARVLGG
jgi:hypothetical protein